MKKLHEVTRVVRREFLVYFKRDMCSDEVPNHPYFAMSNPEYTNKSELFYGRSASLAISESSEIQKAPLVATSDDTVRCISCRAMTSSTFAYVTQKNARMGRAN